MNLKENLKEKLLTPIINALNSENIKKFANKNDVLLFTIAAGLVFGGFAYYFLLSADVVHVNVEEFFEELVKSQDEGADILPSITLGFQTLNAMLAFALTLFSFSLFSSGLSSLFYSKLAKKHGYEKVDGRQALRKTIEWQAYRYFFTFLPIAAFGVIFGILALLGIMLFNPLMMLVGFSAGLVSLLASFVGLNVMFFLSLAVLLTLWNFTGMVFGTEIAVSEPGLDNRTIAQRSGKIVYRSENLLLFLAYSVFVVFLATELARMHDNIPGLSAFVALFLINISAYTGIKYLKTSSYIRSLLNCYNSVKAFTH